LLLAKLWVVFPKLFAWPPFTSVAHLIERLAIFPLVAGGVFELFTGLADTHIWYPWPFNFRAAHYWVAWITIGALIVHLGAKWATTRSALFTRDVPDAYLSDVQIRIVKAPARSTDARSWPRCSAPPARSPCSLLVRRSHRSASSRCSRPAGPTQDRRASP
jgi:hypothetical protein